MLLTRPAAYRGIGLFPSLLAAGITLDFPKAGDTQAKACSLQQNSSLTQKAYIWAQLQQGDVPLIPSCGDMIKAWIKS